MSIKSATFNGKKYRVNVGVDFNAICDAPTKPNPKLILLREPKNDRMTLELLIHEALHATNWPVSETKVKGTARDLARFLWRLGYRSSKK